MPSIFAARLSVNGVKNNKYWYDANYIKGAGSGYGNGNCTHYSVGREGESVNATGKLSLFKGRDPGGYPNAKEFYSSWLYQKGAEPKIGGILCWGSPTNTYGHVAFVERDPVKLSATKWKVLVSESCYSANVKNSIYWRLKEYTVEFGKVTTGVGMVYNGCCYSSKQNIDPRVLRNNNKNQVAVLVDDLSIRKSPNGEKWAGLFALKGIYNILETKKAGDYTWASLAPDVWIALNDKDGWTASYLLPTDADKDKKISELEKQVKELKDKIEKAKSKLQG